MEEQRSNLNISIDAICQEVRAHYISREHIRGCPTNTVQPWSPRKSHEIKIFLEDFTMLKRGKLSDKYCETVFICTFRNSWRVSFSWMLLWRLCNSVCVSFNMVTPTVVISFPYNDHIWVKSIKYFMIWYIFVVLVQLLMRVIIRRWVFFCDYTCIKKTKNKKVISPLKFLK